MGVSSGTRTISVSNTGSIVVPITSITRTGTNANQFSQTDDCGTSIPVGASCTIRVTFLPTSAGAKAATVNVNAGGGAGAQAVSLTGAGIVPTYTLAPSTLAFGNQLRGTASASQSVTLTNTGTLALSITSIAVTGAQFTQTNGCGSSVPVGGQCRLSLVFQPTSTGTKTATLNVSAGGGAGTKSVALSGTGVVPTYTVAPMALAFGNQLRNSSSPSQTVTLTNTGTLALTITGISAAGTQYQVSNSCGGSVPAGGACTITVVFHPTSAGAKNANLNVNAGAGAGTKSVTLTGTGI